MGSAGSVMARNASAHERSRMAAKLAGTLGGETSNKTSGARRRVFKEEVKELDIVLPGRPRSPEPVLKLRSGTRRKLLVPLPGCPEEIDSELLQEEDL